MSSLPVNPDPQDGETGVNIYGYTPWRSLGIVSCIIFGVALVAHITYAIYAGAVAPKRQKIAVDEEGLSSSSSSSSRSWAQRRIKHIVTFETLFSFGCAFEVIGYGFRTASSGNPFLLVNFILNYFMIVVAPVFFSAAQYYCLSALLQRRPSYAKLLPVSGRTIVAIFVVADVVTIVIQIVGAALIGVSESNIADGIDPPLTPDQANDILRAGLAIQVFSITVFLCLLITLLVRLLTQQSRRNEEEKEPLEHAHRRRREPILLSVLTISSVFIYIRTIFRLVEAAQGIGGSAMVNQALFAALETVPVFVAVVLWAALPFHTLL